MSIQLISSIIRQPWAIDRAYADSMMPMVAGLLSRNIGLQFEKEDSKTYEPIIIGADGIGFESAAAAKSASKEPSKSFVFAEVPIIGALTQYNQECGPVGTATIAKWIQGFANDPSVDAILIKANTPGGMVSGTQTLADAISYAKTQKPVLVYCEDGYIASAGYWISSAATEIWASHKTVGIGSIGVMCSFLDLAPHLESQGIKVHEIYSSLSDEKNKDFKLALEGDYSAMQSNVLDPLATTFIDAVKDNRAKINTKKGDPFKGAMFMAEQAMEIGLIDQIGSRDAAIARLQELANKGTTHSHSQNSINSEMKIKAIAGTKLAALLSLEFAEGATEQEVEITSEQVQTLADALDAAHTTEANLNTTIEKQTAQITQLQADLAKKPAAEATEVVSTEDDFPEATKKEAPESSVNKEGNKRAQLNEDVAEFNRKLNDE